VLADQLAERQSELLVDLGVVALHGVEARLPFGGRVEVGRQDEVVLRELGVAEGSEQVRVDELCDLAGVDLHFKFHSLKLRTI
jgi:hypothetical protein